MDLKLNERYCSPEYIPEIWERNIPPDEITKPNHHKSIPGVR